MTNKVTLTPAHGILPIIPTRQEERLIIGPVQTSAVLSTANMTKSLPARAEAPKAQWVPTKLKASNMPVLSRVQLTLLLQQLPFQQRDILSKAITVIMTAVTMHWLTVSLTWTQHSITRVRSEQPCSMLRNTLQNSASQAIRSQAFIMTQQAPHGQHLLVLIKMPALLWQRLTVLSPIRIPLQQHWTTLSAALFHLQASKPVRQSSIMSVSLQTMTVHTQ